MLTLFESRDRRIKDAQEVKRLHTKYGDELVTVLKERSRDRSMKDRDRRHWKRILRKARSYNPQTGNGTAIH
ncbi:hypothetical protein [Sphingorhabdus sp. Alg231-15]|uniref:hypothetical protein n=1 Tax=Sphingorhabdus sp. Alg231-15 TaxID=1922222 RepID=UPI000D54CB83